MNKHFPLPSKLFLVSILSHQQNSKPFSNFLMSEDIEVATCDSNTKDKSTESICSTESM